MTAGEKAIAIAAGAAIALILLGLLWLIWPIGGLRALSPPRELAEPATHAELVP